MTFGAYWREKAMRRKPQLIALCCLAMLLICLMSACGALENDDNTPASVESVAAGEQVQLAFSQGNEAYRIIPYWTSTEESLTGYSLTTGEGAAAEDSAANARLRGESRFATSRPAWISEIRYNRALKRQAWSDKMRSLEREISAAGLVKAEDFESQALRAKTSSECGALELARGDECQNEIDLKFMDFEGDITDFTGQVKGKGEHCSVVVDSDDNVSQSDIDAIIDSFDNVIYPRNHFLFGEATVDGTNYVDRDADGLVMIVLSSMVNESGAVGQYNPSDFVPDALNTSDILYVVVPDSDNSLDSVFGTVAHEYFHMIMFGVKRVKYKADETLWLNESTAHLAEDCSGFGIDNVETALSYLDAVPDYSMAFSGDDLEARGMGFLFMRYLYEQMGGVEYSTTDGGDLTDLGGAEFLTKLVRSNKTGFTVLDAALGESWKDSFFDWLAAVTLDDLPIADDPRYQYQDLYNDPLTGQKIGVCTNCSRKSGDGSNVTYAGLACQPYKSGMDGLVNATGADCVAVSGSGDLFIDTQADEDSLMFGVVRVK